MSAGQHANMLSLYRNIIRHARVYPSKSRDRVLREIRSEVNHRRSTTIDTLFASARDTAALAQKRNVKVQDTDRTFERGKQPFHSTEKYVE